MLMNTNKNVRKKATDLLFQEQKVHSPIPQQGDGNKNPVV
jgi:hypothetical protein